MWHSKLNKCDSGVVGNARPCQGRDRGFEPRLSLLCNHCNPLIDKGLQFFYFMHILELQGHGWSRHGNT